MAVLRRARPQPDPLDADARAASSNDDTLVVARTLRTRYFAVPGRLVNRSGTPTLRAPTHWPWATRFTGALTNLRAVAFAPT